MIVLIKFILLCKLVFAISANALIDIKKHDFSIQVEKNAYQKDGHCYLKKEVADALSQVQNLVKLDSYGLKLLQCKETEVSAVLVDKSNLSYENPNLETGSNPIPEEYKRLISKQKKTLLKAMIKEGFQRDAKKTYQFIYLGK